jgi:hypothetical protein
MNCFRAFINMRYYIWTGLWAAVVIVLCLLPPSEFKSAGFFFIGADKLVHTGMFFVFSILLFNAEIRRTKSPGFQFSLFFSVVAIAIFFALLTEFHRHWHGRIRLPNLTFFSAKKRLISFSR